ncbi:Gluconate kinase [Hyphodiscus hymeniophilus]|uniref:Gluconokinase n=1 Tax=Hyphodiscus hymeniophilus TaxID=353542 RepID=A0A9P6VLU5_9HELO|nr:Gluconate kinase [Hyphodiscus hymeniophilus]
MMLSYDNRAMAQSVTTTSDHLPLSPTSSTTISSSMSSTTDQPKTKHHHIWLITGPAGCGKSTVAQFIAKAMNLPYIEGDEYHPQANVDKMAQGIPLTDADRWDWLTLLREEAINRLSSGDQGVVLTCSALKRKYRDVIRVAPYYDHNVLLHFIYLHASEEVLMKRVGSRQGHFMHANMVHSQFAALQPPGADEKDVISVDVSGSIEAVEEEALAKIRQAVEQALDRDS